MTFPSALKGPEAWGLMCPLISPMFKDVEALVFIGVGSTARALDLEVFSLEAAPRTSDPNIMKAIHLYGVEPKRIYIHPFPKKRLLAVTRLRSLYKFSI